MAFPFAFFKVTLTVLVLVFALAGIKKTTKDDNKSQPKEVSVLAWGNKIIIDENEVKLLNFI